MTIQEVREHQLVQSLHSEDGWWWCHLIEGYWIPSMECGTIHESTIREVARLLKTAEVDPSWSRQLLQDAAAIRAEQAQVAALARAATGASLGHSVSIRYHR